jgi:hypothetical protein
VFTHSLFTKQTYFESSLCEQVVEQTCSFIALVTAHQMSGGLLVFIFDLFNAKRLVLSLLFKTMDKGS